MLCVCVPACVCSHIYYTLSSIIHIIWCKVGPFCFSVQLQRPAWGLRLGLKVEVRIRFRHFQAPAAAGYPVYLWLNQNESWAECMKIWITEKRTSEESIWMHFFPVLWVECSLLCQHAALSNAVLLTNCVLSLCASSRKQCCCPCHRSASLWAEGAHLVLCSQHICRPLSSEENWEISSWLDLWITATRSKFTPLTDYCPRLPECDSRRMFLKGLLLKYYNDCWWLQ